jgi:streptogramin lyase
VAGTFDVGSSATAVAVGENAVWVIDEKKEEVLRVDLTSGRVAARIRVGKDPVAITVGEGAVWVVNAGDGIIDRIDPASNAVVARIRVQQAPGLIAAANGVVLVSSPDLTQRIDPATNQVVASVRGPGAEAGLTAGDDQIWYVDYSFGSNPGGTNTTIKPDFYRFDPATNRGVYVGTFIETNSGNGPPPALAVGDGTAWEGVVGTDNQIRPMSTASGKPGRIITVGTYPVGLALDGIGGLWVLNQGDGTAWKISTASRQSVAVVPVGQRAIGIAADSQSVWVTVESLPAPSS